jgi:type II secretory pathway component PulC
MNAARPQPKRGAALLGVLCLALTGGLYAELTQPIVAARSPVSTNHGQANARPDPTFVMQPRDAYAEVVTRPLFSATRRPPVVVGPGNLSEFKLTGTIISAQGRYALLVQRSRPKIERIVQGQTFQGWLVKSIDSDHVILERDGNLAEMGYSGIADATPQQPTAVAAAVQQPAEEPKAEQPAEEPKAEQPAEEPKAPLPTEAGVPIASVAPPKVTDDPAAGMFRYQVPVQPILNGGD